MNIKKTVLRNSALGFLGEILFILSLIIFKDVTWQRLIGSFVLMLGILTF